ncbi:MAG: response regulator transcription factor [Bacteroidota bacterium]
MNCLIIEDEAPAQRILQRYVTDTPQLSLFGVENNALAASEHLRQEAIDLLFLDINLPKLNGLDFLRTLRSPPQVILTTAYPEYALESYELNVVDYLLKPFSFSRFVQAINKVRQDSFPVESTPRTDHFFVRADKVVHRILLTDLVYCKAEGDFVRVVLKDKVIMVGDTLQQFQQLLAKLGVVQVHRSFLLRLDAMTKLQGNLAHTVRGTVPIGRKYREGLFAQFR